MIEDRFFQIVRTCIQCGVCSASCPVRMTTDEYNPVRIARMIVLGLQEELLKSRAIWLCARCYSCVERCPRGVSFADLIEELQNEAARRDLLPEGLREAAQAILERGWVYDLEAHEYTRADLGLPAPPKAAINWMRKIAEMLKPRVE